MRIHTNTLTSQDIASAAERAGAGVVRCESHGSRSRARAFDVILSGSGRSGGRWGNSGSTGAASHKAASWDEWGMFLAALFDRDPSVMVPNVYPSAEAFHWLTADRYRTLTIAYAHHYHRWDYTGRAAGGAYHVRDCDCGATLRTPSYKLADTLDIVGIDTDTRTGAQ